MASDIVPSPSKARVYCDVNATKPRSYWDYDAHTITWDVQDKYELVRKVGRGKYSEVFEGVNVTCNKICIIKALKQLKWKKLKREIHILETLKGGINIIRLQGAVMDPEMRCASLIFEYVNNTNYRELYATFNDSDVRFYAFELLLALDYCHSKGIMHRDVKPQNVMIHHEAKQLKLIDWGLADFYHPEEKYNVRVASKCYKAPELLLNYPMYDYSMDLWSFGCLFASMIFRKEPFFYGKDNFDQLICIVEVIGSYDFYQYVIKYNMQVSRSYDGLIEDFPRKDWDIFCHAGNKDVVSDEAIDLLSKLLKYDHQERLAAPEALDHPYFCKLQIYSTPPSC